MSLATPDRGFGRVSRAAMIRGLVFSRALPLAFGILLAASASAQPPAAAPAQPATKAATPKAAKPAKKAPVPGPAIELEPKAIEILKAASARLAAARTMTFTAEIGYESPSRLGPALVYTTRAEVTLQRPDKLRVIVPGDGPASEFYYDGKTMVAFAPAENLVATAPAPPTIDAALETAYDTAHIYYPFADVIVADPYKDIADGLRVAFYIGQSKAVGGTTTDMIAYVSDHAFVQAWIGAEDKLPRRLRAVFRKDRSQLRHQMDLSNWQLDVPIPADAFTASSAAKAAMPIAFARPEPANMAPGARSLSKGKPAATQ